MTGAVIIYLLFVAAQLAASLLSVAFTRWGVGGGEALAESMGASPVARGWALLLCEGLLALGLWLWYARLEPALRRPAQMGSSPRAWLRLRPVRREVESERPSLRLVFASVAVVLLFAVGLHDVLEPLALSADGANEVFDGMKRDPLCLLLLCLVGPLAEELVFRAGIVRSLYRSGAPAWVAAVTGAAVFALVHDNWAQAVPAFVIGTVLGLLYLRTGNLRLCLPAHMANNALAAALLFFPMGKETTTAHEVFIGVFLLLCAACWLPRLLRRPR